MKAHHVAIALGGNLGQTEDTFHRALALLADAGLASQRVSSWHRTAPVGCHLGTPDFLNGAVVGKWDGTPESLLETTQRIEQALGRPAVHDSRGSRTIDLDILLFDDLQLSRPALTIPHPRMLQRRFVLEPLAEIASDWLIPGYGKTVLQAWQELDSTL